MCIERMEMCISQRRLPQNSFMLIASAPGYRAHLIYVVYDLVLPCDAAALLEDHSIWFFPFACNKTEHKQNMTQPCAGSVFRQKIINFRTDWVFPGPSYHLAITGFVNDIVASWLLWESSKFKS